jgi:dihydrofolate reductase
MARPRISVFIAHTLDGLIATDDDRLDWLFAAGAEGEDYGYDAFMADVDAVAMGRGTYSFIEHTDWSYGDRPVYVFTRREVEPRPEFTYWERTPAQAVAEWEAAGHRHVYVDGGVLISSFLDAGLVDDLTLTVVPLLLGSGKRLFHPVGRSTALRLESVTPFPSGMVSMRYTRVEQDED